VYVYMIVTTMVCCMDARQLSCHKICGGFQAVLWSRPSILKFIFSFMKVLNSTFQPLLFVYHPYHLAILRMYKYAWRRTLSFYRFSYRGGFTIIVAQVLEVNTFCCWLWRWHHTEKILTFSVYVTTQHTVVIKKKFPYST